MILRFLNWQGIAGIAVGLTLLVMLTVQKLEAVHWKKQSRQFEQLYRDSERVLAATVAETRAAAATARAADAANAARVAAEQRAINERTKDEFETRLAAARARAAAGAERVRVETGTAADPGAGRAAPMPGLPAAAGGAAQATGEDRLPRSDRLIATEQAIQLEELIKWVRRQAKVDNNRAAGASPPGN
jgi:hypothetical protein